MDDGPRRDERAALRALFMTVRDETAGRRGTYLVLGRFEFRVSRC